MQPISRRLLNKFNSESLDLVGLLDIRVVGAGISWTNRFVSPSTTTVSWNGNTYNPTAMSRGGYQSRISTSGGDQPSLTLAVQNIDGQMASLVNRVKLVGSRATYRITDRALLESSTDSIVVADGFLGRPSIGVNSVSIAIENIAKAIDRCLVPRRVFSSKCNYQFGSTGCGVDKSAAPNTLETTAQAGSTRDYIVLSDTFITTTDGLPDDLTDFWDKGSLWVFAGTNAPSWRRIVRYAFIDGQHRVYFANPFVVTLEEGDEVKLIRGCPKTKEGCSDEFRHGDFVPFGGFEEVPYGRVSGEWLTVRD